MVLKLSNPIWVHLVSTRIIKGPLIYKHFTVYLLLLCCKLACL
jgi:hypothetical protein